MEVYALHIADTEGSQYGGINAGANDVHLPAVGMRCLDIVNANRDEREARGIDQNVENSRLEKLEQQTSGRKNSGLSEPNSERKPVCQVFK